MNFAQMATYQDAIPPAAIIDDASATASAVDTIGSNYCEIVIQLGATDIAMTALKLQESDDDSTYTDVAGANFDGGTDTEGNTLALPSATDDNQTLAFQVNMDGRKRYLKVVATFGDGTAGGFIAGIARLSTIAVMPTADASIADGGVCRV